MKNQIDRKISVLLGAEDKKELEAKIKICASKLDIDAFINKVKPLVSKC
jgi:hypothetical protein